MLYIHIVHNCKLAHKTNRLSWRRRHQTSTNVPHTVRSKLESSVCSSKVWVSGKSINVKINWHDTHTQIKIITQHTHTHIHTYGLPAIYFISLLASVVLGPNEFYGWMGAFSTQLRFALLARSCCFFSTHPDIVTGQPPTPVSVCVCVCVVSPITQN